MDYIEREQWIEVCQMFFDAYGLIKFKSLEWMMIFLLINLIVFCISTVLMDAFV